MTTVVDASVVLAWLQDEAGSEVAEQHLVDGVMGAANWSEVLQKARQHGAETGLVARLLSSFGLTVVDVTAADAERAADLWRQGSPLSLEDRLCLALGLRLGVSVATTDSAWESVPQGPSRSWFADGLRRIADVKSPAVRLRVLIAIHLAWASCWRRRHSSREHFRPSPPVGYGSLVLIFATIALDVVAFFIVGRKPQTAGTLAAIGPFLFIGPFISDRLGYFSSVPAPAVISVLEALAFLTQLAILGVAPRLRRGAS